MPVAVMATTNTAPAAVRKSSSSSLAPEKKYKCQFCARAFSRSEHRSRHERSRTFNPRHECGIATPLLVQDAMLTAFLFLDTKERPFKCMKCRSTFVRRDLLLRHDRTVCIPCFRSARTSNPTQPIANLTYRYTRKMVEFHFIAM